MTTKRQMIKELVDLANDNETMEAMIKDGMNAIVIITYSPEELGADDDCWHYIVNVYADHLSAVNRFAETACSSSTLIVKTSEDSVSDFITKAHDKVIEFTLDL